MTASLSILNLIGSTPLIQAKHLDTGVCELYLKLENRNPGGSIKDRLALAWINTAETSGHIQAGMTLVAASAGNTGISLAWIAKQKGYFLHVVMPDTASPEKIAHIKALGAKVQLTRSNVSSDHPDFYYQVAEQLATHLPNAYFINSTPLDNHLSIANEIFGQLNYSIDAIILGKNNNIEISSDIASYIKTSSSSTQVILADAVNPLFPFYYKNNKKQLESISDSENKTYLINDKESFQYTRELLLKEGILASVATGTTLAAAIQYCQQQTTPKKVVVIITEAGNTQLSKVYNDHWMLEHGFLDRMQHGDLRDLIQRPYKAQDTIVVNPNESLIVAYQQMKRHDISQLPVIENEQLVGILDESDVLLHIYGDEARFNDNVATAMVTKLDRIEATSPIEALLPVFDRGQVAIIIQEQQFLGLITRIDLLNYLRWRV